MLFNKIFFIILFNLLHLNFGLISNEMLKIRSISLNQNNENVKKFQCMKPQKRSYSVYYLPEFQNILQGKTYTPDFVVLHRCDEDSGCCLNRKKTFKCQPKLYNNVTFEFMVENIIEQLPNELIVLKNHTLCHCGS